MTESAEIEFEIMKHSNFTFFTIFEHELALIRVSINILALVIRIVYNKYTFFFAKGDIKPRSPLNV
jgi:hypothetical protein